MSAGTREADYFGGGGGGDAPGGGLGGGDPSAQQQPLQKYRFSPEEMKAIRECNRESFYFRCLPIGTLLGVGTYYSVRYGYLKPSPRFGAGPKMFFASIVGYFIGKFSYQHVCAEKLMALPNSHLGEILRKQKGRMGIQETLSMEPGFATAAPVGAPAFANSDFSQPRSYSDVGDTRPMSGFDSEGSSSVSGYDSQHQGSASSSNYDTTHQMLDDENLPPKRNQFFTSYDDLRRQNRVDYENRLHNRHQQPPPPAAPIESTRGSTEGFYERRNPPSSPKSDGSAPKNKYGDVWDDKPAY